MRTRWRKFVHLWGFVGAVGCGGASTGDDLGQAEGALTTCSVNSVPSLRACLSNLGQYDVIQFTADVTCSGSVGSATSCCGPSLPNSTDTSLIQIVDRTGKTIDGAGHTLHRLASQAQCGAFYIAGNTSLTTIKNLVVDDHATDATMCGAGGCALTVQINSASETTMSGLTLRNTAGTAVQVWSATNTSFVNSTIQNAGVLGLEVGPNPEMWRQGAPLSRGLQIVGSTFTDIRTNAVAIEGLTGLGGYLNKIDGSTFRRNHRFGLWNLCGSPPDICGGGQVYIGRADHLTVSNNTIADGFCTNCQLVTTGHHGVHGIELGYSPAEPGLEAPISDVDFRGNTIRNNHAFGLFMDQGSHFGPNVSLRSNLIVNNGGPTWDATSGTVALTGVTVSGNIIPTKRLEYGFETPTANGALEPGWTQWVGCGDNTSTAVRWCPAASEVMDGSCVLRMTTTSHITPCGGGIQGLWVASPPQVLGGGRPLYIDTYSRNGGSAGSVCVVYLSSSGAVVGQNCVAMNADTWRYNADPALQYTTPAGTAFIQMRYNLQTPSAFADVDHTFISW